MTRTRPVDVTIATLARGNRPAKFRDPKRPDGLRARRGAAAIQIAACSTIVFGMAALAIDFARVHTTRAELQSAADAGALAAAAVLVDQQDPLQAAVEAADQFAQLNAPAGYLTRVESQDVELGHAIFDPNTRGFQFQAGGTHFDAVRVTVRRTAEGEVRVPFLFAPVLGYDVQRVQARAAAVLIPRDIALVIDLSGSMNDDSELRHYRRYLGEEGQWRDGIQVNLRDVWCALDGPAPARPYVPGPEEQTEYAGDAGPAVGAMTTWGAPIVPESYDPTGDAGLWYIRKGATTSNPAIESGLAARGYTPDETTCLMSGSRDASYSSQWRNRTAVMLALGEWRSGRPGGRPGGDGDNIVENGEVAWLEYPTYRSSWSWANYIDYVGSGSSEMVSTQSALRYRFGLKTFVNFLLESRPRYSQTNILWQTPEQPLQAVKDAVQAMLNVIASLESTDQVALEIFAQTARHEVDLTTDLQFVAERLYHRQAGHYDTLTNMGAGLQTALAELSSERARSSARKVIVLMSDGKPNIDRYGNYVAEGSPAVNGWVLELAQA
ncbi:MAG: VWA domain-containing protein, partial [Planctomycetota bacterium]